MSVGKHSPPIDGVAVANGHAPSLIPFAIQPLQVLPRGPVEGWPQDAAASPERDRWRHARRVMSARRAWLAAVPVILVNAVAFGAQLAFWRVHVALLAGAVTVALAVESIAVYLAWHAHLAQLADDSALRLRLSAYGMALLIGALNYSHFDGPHWRPAVPAVTFGMMSAISPWLWSVHSRRASRDALKKRGLIEPHAVRLGATRWQWHPVRSWRVMFRATWLGETDPAKAVALAPLGGASPVTPEPPAGASPDAPAPASPDAPEHRQEGVSEAPSAAPAPAPRDARPKPRAAASAAPPATRALAVLTANPGLDDAEVMKRAKVSRSTVTRARRELTSR